MTTYIHHLTIPHQVFANAPASILLPVTLGAGVGYSTRPKQTAETYNLIRQPPLRPPPWVFGPVWTVLYGVTGYAAHRGIGAALGSARSGGAAARTAATLYTAQLGLNLAWMPLFFGLRRPALALADIAALLGANGYLAWLFFAPAERGGLGLPDSVAAWCYVPYVAWLGFAAYLNLGVGYLNGWDISDEALLRRKNAEEKKAA